MRGDALSILRRNSEEVQRHQEDCSSLKQGILWELAQLCPVPDGELADRFSAVLDAPLCSEEFASLCRAVCGGLTDRKVLASFLLEDSSDENPPDTRTAYLRNAYTDRAFACFSQDIHRLSAQYQTSFTAGCEEVYDGRCSYCILPIRNTEDGTLASFIRLITKYDLKIARVCDIITPDGDNTTRYALLRRGLELTVPEDGILQATLVLPRGISTGRFLCACENTGAAVESVTTLPLRYSAEITSLSICFHIDTQSTAPLLCFLSHAAESCNEIL